MSWEYAQGWASSDQKTAGTSVTAYIPFVAGSLSIVGITFDNLTATTPTVSSIYKPAGETNNWTLLAYHDSNQSGGGGGVRSELWALVSTVTDTYAARTITLSQSVTAKAVETIRCTGGGSSLGVVSTIQAGLSSSTTISTSVASLTGRTPQVGELVIILAGIEGTTGEDATMFAYDNWHNGSTTGQGATSNVCGDLRTKVITSAGDISILLDVAGDKGICGAVLAAGPAAPPANFSGSGTLEAHKTRYSDLVMQTSASSMKFYYRFNREREYYESTGTLYEADSSPKRRDQQVAPSNAGGSYAPGDPLPAGFWSANVRESILQAFGHPGLIFGGDTGTDFSVAPRNFRTGVSTDTVHIELYDYFMDICGGGRYYPGEGGIGLLTCAAMINLESYPVDSAGAPHNLTVAEHSGGRWYVDVTGDGKLRLYVHVRFGPVTGDYQQVTYDLVGNTALKLGHTHHVAWIFDGGYLRLFIDGVEDASLSVAWDYQPPGTNEREQVVIAGSPTGGTFTLTFNGQTTGAIAYNAAAATVQAALEALSNVNAGDFLVYGPYSQTGGRYWDVYAAAPPAQYGWTDIAEMTATSSLTGGTSPTVTVSTVTQGAPAPAPIHYDTGEILWSSGSGGTDGGGRAYWLPGSMRCYLLNYFPKGRIDEVTLWNAGLTPATIASLANAALVDPPGAGLRGLSKLTAVQPYPLEVMARTPEVYFRLNDASGSTVMTDYSGHARHGTYVGSPQLAQSGLIAGGDAAMVPSTTANAATKGGTLPFASWMLGSTYTWELIFKCTVMPPSNDYCLITAGAATETLTWDSFGRLTWRTENGNRFISDNAQLELGATYHVAMVKDGTYRTLYVNGLPIARSAVKVATTVDVTRPLNIGFKDSTSPLTFAGTLDEVAIYSEALSPAWIYNHARAMTIAPIAPRAELSGTGTLTAVEVSNFATSVAMSGSGTLAATTAEVHLGHGDCAGDGVLTAVPVVGFSGTADTTGLGTVFVTAIPQALADVARVGIGTLSTVAWRPIQQIKPEATADPDDIGRRSFWGKAL